MWGPLKLLHRLVLCSLHKEAPESWLLVVLLKCSGVLPLKVTDKHTDKLPATSQQPFTEYWESKAATQGLLQPLSNEQWYLLEILHLLLTSPFSPPLYISLEMFYIFYSCLALPACLWCSWSTITEQLRHKGKRKTQVEKSWSLYCKSCCYGT